MSTSFFFFFSLCVPFHRFLTMGYGWIGWMGAPLLPCWQRLRHGKWQSVRPCLAALGWTSRRSFFVFVCMFIYYKDKHCMDGCIDLQGSLQ
jgi:hypothetical protein